ncbi:hypothetical protein SAMCCGM7_pC0100 (plasmid) [Sinorhizobium americanum CCGM7]|nr:hypothetical protein SAMCCGM7_pC0100 [Sinorhizobium americanum CCGM7]
MTFLEAKRSDVTLVSTAMKAGGLCGASRRWDWFSQHWDGFDAGGAMRPLAPP